MSTESSSSSQTTTTATTTPISEFGGLMDMGLGKMLQFEVANVSS